MEISKFRTAYSDIELIKYVIEITEDGKIKYIGYPGIHMGLIDSLTEASKFDTAQEASNFLQEAQGFSFIKNNKPKIRKLKIAYTLE